MPLEIEHRFLVNPRKLPRLRRGSRLEQGYLSLDPLVRVRIVKPPAGRARGFLTVKSRGLRVRQEFEYAIPVAHARKLMKLCGARLIVKVRARMGAWEIDRYLGRHTGLWLAEIELPSRKAHLPRPLPPWLSREVTSDPRYTNARLALMKKMPARWR